jgi:hypothetical protein
MMENIILCGEFKKYSRDQTNDLVFLDGRYFAFICSAISVMQILRYNSSV